MAAETALVVITDFINDELQVERSILGDLARVVALDAFRESELEGQIEQAAAVMLYHNLGLSALSIGRLEQCRLIVRCGVGFDNVDYRLARQRGIPVANVPDYGTEEVADSAIGMTLTLTRGIHQYNARLQRTNDPWMYTLAQPLHRLRGRVFAIVGLGRIGIATALRARALGMDVRYYDPYRADGFDKAIGVRRVDDLKTLLDTAYVVSMHCPLTDETRHMINAETLQWMQPGSYLINTARGGVVDTSVIPDALAEGRLAGAGIDVLVDEPPPADHPLIAAWRDPGHPAADRLIVNPHAAFYSEEGLLDMRRKGAEACRNALTGKPLRNIINE